MLSKYDVRVLVNDTELGILEHGKKEKYSVELEKGEYVFEWRMKRIILLMEQ